MDLFINFLNGQNMNMVQNSKAKVKSLQPFSQASCFLSLEAKRWTVAFKTLFRALHQ